MIQLPENFETYAEARKAGFLRMKQLKESGRKVVGIFCSFVPTELIEAAGGTAAPLCATSEEPISAAEADLPKISALLLRQAMDLLSQIPVLIFISRILLWEKPPVTERKKCLS